MKQLISKITGDPIMVKLKATGFSLTNKERDIIATVSAERNLHNDSAALRQIINEWNDRQSATYTHPTAAVIPNTPTPQEA